MDVFRPLKRIESREGATKGLAMTSAIERLTTAKHSAGFVVDDLAAASQIETESDQLRCLLKQAAELFDSISQVETAFKNSGATHQTAPQ